MRSVKAKNILYKAKRIAVVRTDRLGDMALTLPLCQALKNEFPETTVAMIARSYTGALLENCPALDSFFFIDSAPGGIKQLFSENEFDAVFFPRPRFDECLAGFLAGIPLRVGSAYRLYSFLMNFRINDHRKVSEYHEAEYNVRMLSAILAKNIETKLVRPWVNLEAKEFADKILNGVGIQNGQPYMVIHPGSGGSSRDWSAGNFGKAASAIGKIKSLQVIITGTETESANCAAALNECPAALNLCGKFNIKELFAVIEGASLLIANSTGVLHIGAALGRPVVGLFPNTPHLSAKRWGPYSENSVVVSPPESRDAALRDDMSRINAEEVVKASIELLDRQDALGIF